MSLMVGPSVSMLVGNIMYHIMYHVCETSVSPFLEESPCMDPQSLYAAAFSDGTWWRAFHAIAYVSTSVSLEAGNNQVT